MKACDLKCGRYAHHRDADQPYTCKACATELELSVPLQKRYKRGIMLDNASAHGMGVVIATTVRVNQPWKSERMARTNDRHSHKAVRERSRMLSAGAAAPDMTKAANMPAIGDTNH